jgi:Ni,Fe-hydrogenase III component G
MKEPGYELIPPVEGGEDWWLIVETEVDGPAVVTIADRLPNAEQIAREIFRRLVQ